MIKGFQSKLRQMPQNNRSLWYYLPLSSGDERIDSILVRNVRF